MIVLGIDQSLERTGWAIVQDGKVVTFGFHEVKVARQGKGKRKLKDVRAPLKEVRASLRSLVHQLDEKYHFDKIIVERVRTFSKGFISTNVIIELGSLIKFVIDGVEAPVYSVDTRSWKSKVVGRADATKEQTVDKIMERVTRDGFFAKQERKTLHIDTSVEVMEINHDVADAICIALYAFEKEPKLQLEE